MLIKQADEEWLSRMKTLHKPKLLYEWHFTEDHKEISEIRKDSSFICIGTDNWIRSKDYRIGKPYVIICIINQLNTALQIGSRDKSLSLFCEKIQSQTWKQDNEKNALCVCVSVHLTGTSLSRAFNLHLFMKSISLRYCVLFIFISCHF